MVDWSVPASQASNKRLLYEIALKFLTMLPPVVWLIESQTISWTGLGLGMFAAALVYFISYTPPAGWASRWFKQIGVSGRFTTILIAAIFIWGGMWLFKPPTTTVGSFIIGILFITSALSIFRLANRLVKFKTNHQL